MDNFSLSYLGLSSASTLAIGYATNKKGRFSKGCPCPVCGSESSKCKINNQSNLIVHCMDKRKGDYVPSWRYIKEAGNVWSLWIEEKNSEDYDRQQWRELSEARQKHRELEKKKLLSESNRHKYWLQIFEQLTLDEKDRDHLRHRRGLSDEEIARGGFVSVRADQEVEGYFPKNFSGTRYDRHVKNCRLMCKFDGFIAPMRNAKEQIIGAQAYTYQEEPKYVWLSKSSESSDGGKNSLNTLPCGDQPLAIHRPKFPALKQIIYAEGSITKPFIASCRLNEIVIGAVGGNFGKQTLHAQLREIRKQLGVETFNQLKHVLAADAGAITNPHILNSYKTLKDNLRTFEDGLSLEVMWWRQYDKTDGDIDEIDLEITKIEYRPFESFFNEGERLIRRNRLAEERLKNQLYKVGNRQFNPLSKERLTPYYPGCLPAYNDLNLCAEVSYFFTTPEHQLAFYEEAKRKGYTAVLNTCPPGWGKSYQSGKLPDIFRLGRADDEKTVLYAYYTQQSRCPSTETVERNFTPLTIRHTGMIADKHRKTALGQPFYRIPKASDPKSAEVVVESNCKHSQMFAALAAKGHDYRNVNGDENPICQNCTMVEECKATGYRYQRKRDLGSNDDRTQAQEVAIRLHPASASNWMEGYEYTIPNSKKKGYIPGFDEVIAIWDEAETLLAPVIQTITRDELDFCWRHLERCKLAIHKKLASFREAIDLMMSNPPTWGWGTADVRKTLDTIIAWDELLLTSDEWKQIKQTFEPDISKAMLFGNVNHELLNNAPSSALVDLLSWWRVWGPDDYRTAIRIGEKTITLTRPPARMIELINSQASFNVFLDATMDRSVLAAKLGIALEDILVCTALEPESNVRRLRVTGFGRNGRDRAESTDARLKRLKSSILTYLAGRYEFDFDPAGFTVEVADYLNKREEHGAKIGHMSNSRGTNEVAGCDVLINHGLPVPNMGAVHDEFYTLDTDLFTAEDYYDHRIASETIQLDKRNRASRYNGWHYVIYVTTDALPFEDVEDVTIDEIEPDASALKLSHTRILEVGKEMVKRGIKLTQTELATRLGVSEIWLKKWLKAQPKLDWKKLKAEIEKAKNKK